MKIRRPFVATAAQPAVKGPGFDFRVAQMKYGSRVSGLVPALFDQLISVYATLAQNVKMAQGLALNESGALSQDYVATCLSARRALGLKNDYLRVGPDFVETRCSFSSTSPNLTLSFGDGDNAEAKRLLKIIAPDFEMPVLWSYTRAGGSAHFEPPKDFLQNPVRRLVPLKALQKHTPLVPQSWQGPPSYHFAPFFDGKAFGPNGAKAAERDGSLKAYGVGFEDRLFLAFALHSIWPRVDPESEFMLDIPDPGQVYNFDPLKDSWQGGAFTGLDLNFSVVGVIRWPEDYALYATASKDKTSFVPALFHSVVATNRHRLSQVSTFGKPVRKMVGHISNFEDLELQAKLAPFPKKLRANEDGFVVLGASAGARMGDIVYVPLANNVSAYVQALKESYDPDTFTVGGATKLTSMPLYTDPQTEKFSYLTESGSIDVLELEGSRALDDLTIHHVLADTSTNSKSANPDSSPYKGWLLRIRDGLSLVGEKMSYGDRDRFVLGRAADALLRHDSLYAFLEQSSDLAQSLGEVCQRVLDKDFVFEGSNDTTTHVPYSQRVLYSRFACVLFAKYAKSVAHYRAVAQDAALVYSDEFAKGRDFDKDCVVANLPGLTRLLPHQVKMQLTLQPKVVGTKLLYASVAIVSAGVGSGKSVAAAIATIAAYLYRGIIKRPLIALPDNLVAGMVSEIQKFSQGQLNAFPLTLNSVRTMEAVTSGTYNFDSTSPPDYAALEGILKGLPLNTILIAGYSFFTSHKADQVYGDKIITRYFIPEFLRDVAGVDFVAADEAHFVKNPKAAITRALQILLAAAGIIKVPMSGTLIVNTVADFVGLGAIANPALLRDEAEFFGRFGDAPDGPAVRSVLQTQASFVQVNKWDYAAFLSPVVQQYHFIESLPPDFMKFYLQLAQDKLQEFLEQNPEIAKLLYADGTSKADPEESNLLEERLQTYFQAIELFLSAPDAKDEKGEYIYKRFVDSVRDPKLLVSPKVAKIAEICRGHFAKYFTPEVLASRAAYVKATRAAGKKPIPMGNKIIIFSNRRATPGHVFENLPPDVKKYAKLYTSDMGMAAIAEWINSDSLRVLVASEMTIKEGQNFQMANRLIRIESGYRPGDQEEQAPGRVDRPDPDKVYDRDVVYIDWILCDNTVEVIKACRLIHKIMGKARADYAQDELGRGGIASYMTDVDARAPATPLVKLSLDNIRSPELTSRDNMTNYFEAYKIYGDWKSFMRAESAKTTPQPHPISSVNRVTIPGSAPIAYAPRVPGQVPLSSTGYEVESVAIQDAEAAMSGEGTDGQDVVTVAVGDVVDTEFGLGVVTGVLTHSLWVSIKGLTSDVKVPKTTTWFFINPEDAKAVKASIAKSSTQAKLPAGIVAAKPARVAPAAPTPPAQVPGPGGRARPNPARLGQPAVLPTPVPATPPPALPVAKPRAPFAGIGRVLNIRGKAIADAEKRLYVDTPEDRVTVSTLNGTLALTYALPDPQYVSDFGFRQIPPLLRATFKNPGQLKAFRDALVAKPRVGKGYTVPPALLEALDTTLRHWKAGNPAYMHQNAEPFDVTAFVEKVFKKKAAASTALFLLFVNLETKEVSVGLNPLHQAANKLKLAVPGLVFTVDGDGSLYKVGIKRRLYGVLSALGPILDVSLKDEVKILQATKEKA